MAEKLCSLQKQGKTVHADTYVLPKFADADLGENHSYRYISATPTATKQSANGTPSSAGGQACSLTISCNVGDIVYAEGMSYNYAIAMTNCTVLQSGSRKLSTGAQMGSFIIGIATSTSCVVSIKNAYNDAAAYIYAAGKITPT